MNREISYYAGAAAGIIVLAAVKVWQKKKGKAAAFDERRLR